MLKSHGWAHHPNHLYMRPLIFDFAGGPHAHTVPSTKKKDAQGLRCFLEMLKERRHQVAAGNGARQGHAQ